MMISRRIKFLQADSVDEINSLVPEHEVVVSALNASPQNDVNVVQNNNENEDSSEYQKRANDILYKLGKNW